MFPQNNLVNLSEGLMIVPGKTSARMVACFETSLTSLCIKEPLRCVHTAHMAVHTAMWLVCCFAWQRKNWLWCLQCSFWLVEFFTDAEWPANKQHRKPTSSAIHLSMELRLHGTNLLFLIVSLSSAESEFHGVSRCLESTSKHAWNFWLARKLNNSNGLTTAFGGFWRCSVGFEMFDALKREQNFCVRDGKSETLPRLKIWCWHFCKLPGGWDRSTVEKLKNRTFLRVTGMADTARQQGRRNSADKFHAVAAIYTKKKNMQMFFLAKRVFKGKCWNDATKIGKSQMVSRWSKLTDSRRNAWNCHSWTWDNMGWLPHIEMSVSNFITPYPGPFWLKNVHARFAVRVHFFRAVEIGFIVYLQFVNFFSGCFRTYLFRVGSSLFNLV